MSLCEGRHAVGGGVSVDSDVGVRVVLPLSVCCLPEHSVAVFMGILVSCCRCFGPCLCSCMLRSFGLQGWASNNGVEVVKNYWIS